MVQKKWKWNQLVAQYVRMNPGNPKETISWMALLGVIPFLIAHLSHRSQVNDDRFWNRFEVMDSELQRVPRGTFAKREQGFHFCDTKRIPLKHARGGTAELLYVPKFAVLVVSCLGLQILFSEPGSAQPPFEEGGSAPPWCIEVVVIQN